MGLRYIASAAANRILGRFGARLERSDSPKMWQYEELWSRYAQMTTQFHDCILDRVFYDLPRVPGRESLLANLVGTQLGEALWLLSNFHESLEIDGDICEFGIAEGATSALMANELMHAHHHSESAKKLWLFDSFEGLPRPHEKDELIDDIFNLGSMQAYQGRMKYGVHEVRSKLRSVAFPEDRIEIVPGFIEQSIKQSKLPARVCFAYVDFDFYEPILVSLKFLADIMPLGGRVLVDDYGFFSAGAKQAVHEFLEACPGVFEMELPPSWAGHFAILKRA